MVAYIAEYHESKKLDSVEYAWDDEAVVEGDFRDLFQLTAYAAHLERGDDFATPDVKESIQHGQSPEPPDSVELA